MRAPPGTRHTRRIRASAGRRLCPIDSLKQWQYDHLVVLKLLPTVLAVVFARSFDGSGRKGDSGADAGAVITYCQRSFPDSYTGLVATEDSRSFVVYRVPAPGLDEALRARFPGLRFDIRDTAVNEHLLSAAAGRIAEDIETWRDRGVEIVAVGPDPAGTVTVFTTTPRAAAGVLPGHYQPIPLEIKESGPVILVPPARWPRRGR